MKKHRCLRGRGLVLLAALCAGALLSGSAWAQAGAGEVSLALRNFRAAPGPWDGVVVQSAQVEGHLQLSGGLLVDYARRPLIFESRSSSEMLRSIIDNRVQAELYLAMSLAERIELSLALPTTLYQDGDGISLSRPEDPSTFGFGDLRMGAKARLFDLEPLGVVLGAAFELTAPTGAGGDLMGDGFTTWAPSLLATRVGKRYRALLQLGYRFRDERQVYNLTLDDEIEYRLGFEWALVEQDATLVAEVFGALRADAPFDSQDVSPLELLLAERTPLVSHLVATVGFGVGLLKGYGTPEYRMFAGLAWAPRISDRDGDGIRDADDRCPDQPEDMDEFEDQDGCPDPDNDQDGLLDPADRCPNEAEDKDSFEDQDGCPDPDNDRDGILDAADRCPNDPEDKDGFEDQDGCPDSDNDRDGILDAADRCPNDAEDPDGFEDQDGCPDPDNDRDRILDPVDRCPNEAEVYNGIDDEDGCPDEGRVVIAKDRIVIRDRIYFEFNKDTIKAVSFSLLNEIAALIKGNPQLKLIRIEGHTDSVGDGAYNLELSQRRAMAVMRYLVGVGVGPARLVAQGFGEDRPIDTNETTQGRSQNRRVEFIIVEED